MFPLSLLPQDTRIVELLSGIALVLVGLGLMLSGNGLVGTHNSVQENTFWCLITMAFGALQISAIAMCRSMEHLRFILAWVSGSFWVWVASANMAVVVSATDIATIGLGVMNLYAFVINLLLVKQSWK
jgi:hypothetical protein